MKKFTDQGRDYEFDANPGSKYSWAVWFTDEFGTETVRIHRGYEKQRSAINGLNYQLKKLDKQDIGAMGRVFEIE